MTQNIEQRTLAATSTLESSAKIVDEIAHKDTEVVTPVGMRKSFPQISREWDEKSTELKTVWENDSATLREEWRNERNELSVKALGVKPWESGLSEENINQQRRWTDNNTYLPKTVPALMVAEGPDDNWIPYAAAKDDILNDVFGRKPIALITGLVLTPDANMTYPKLLAFGKTWELKNDDQALTVDSFSESQDEYLIITLTGGSQVIAQKIEGASRGWVNGQVKDTESRVLGADKWPEIGNARQGDQLSHDADLIQINNQVYRLMPSRKQGDIIDLIDSDNYVVRFNSGESNLQRMSTSDAYLTIRKDLSTFGAKSNDPTFDSLAAFERAIASGELVTGSGTYYVSNFLNFNRPSNFVGDFTVKPLYVAGSVEAPIDNLCVVTSSDVRLKFTLDGDDKLPRFDAPYIGGVAFKGACMIASSAPFIPINGSQSKPKLENVDLTGMTFKNSPNSGLVAENLVKSKIEDCNHYRTGWDEERASPAKTYVIGGSRNRINRNYTISVIANGLGNTKDITINNSSNFECESNYSTREYLDEIEAVEHGFHAAVFVKACVGGVISRNKGYDVGMGVKVEADNVGVLTEKNYYEKVYDYGINGQGHIDCDYIDNVIHTTRRFGIAIDVHSPSSNESRRNRLRGNRVINANAILDDTLTSDNKVPYLLRGVSNLEQVGTLLSDNYSHGSDGCAYGVIIITDDPEITTSRIADLVIASHTFTGAFSQALIGLSGNIDGISVSNPIINDAITPAIFKQFNYTKPINDVSFVGATISKGSQIGSIILSGKYGGSLIITGMRSKSGFLSYTLRIDGCVLKDLVYKDNESADDDGSNILITNSSNIEKIDIQSNGGAHPDANPYFFRIDNNSNFEILNILGNSHRGRGKYQILSGDGKLGVSDNSATVTSYMDIASTLGVTGYIGFNNLTSNPRISHTGEIPATVITM